jgi:hypothetical protein
MSRVALRALGASLALLLPSAGFAQVQALALDSARGLRLHNVSAEPATLQGKAGLRLTLSEETARRLKADPGQAAGLEQLAFVEGAVFANGVIEAEIAGEPAPGAFGGARGFVGIAFRTRDERTYDAFYLRPTNGRAEDQERRNHSTQYIAHPDWTWSRLRQETPSRYESYVDLVPGAWTRVRSEVRGERARLFVHGAEQPALIVNDLKSGPKGQGGVALWLGPGTVAHFRELTIRPE